MSNSEVPTEFHSKDTQFLAEQEFMQVRLLLLTAQCCSYFSFPMLMQHHILTFVRYTYSCSGVGDDEQALCT